MSAVPRHETVWVEVEGVQVCALCGIHKPFHQKWVAEAEGIEDAFEDEVGIVFSDGQR